MAQSCEQPNAERAYGMETLPRSPAARKLPRHEQRKNSTPGPKPRSQGAAPKDYTCRDEVELIADYLAERLASTTLAAFEEHLGQCPDCAAFLNTYKKTIEAARSFLKTDAPELLPGSLKLRRKDFDRSRG